MFTPIGLPVLYTRAIYKLSNMVSLLRRLDKLLSLQAKISPKNLLKPTQVRWFDGFRNTRSIQEIKDAYNQQKRDTSGKCKNPLKEEVVKSGQSFQHTIRDERGIFANNELSLKYIDVYGFDYDYTLASYSDALHFLIYDLAIGNLISFYGYPKGIQGMKYSPDFAVRGLHYDTANGLLMKIDAFHNIMLGSVYRGLQQIPDEEVFRIYGGIHLSISKINPDIHLNELGQSMHHMIDMFSYPEMCLLSNVAEFLYQKGIPYDPENLFHDCVSAVESVHTSGQMYEAVMDNIGTYLEKSPRLGQLLNKMVSSGKKLFLITNSPYPFVDRGMQHMLGTGWTDLFDVIVTRARKPAFFKQVYRPFRYLDTAQGLPTWRKVSKFEKGKIYLEGNVEQFIKFTGWYGPTVLYFGDHVYSDLKDPVLHHGWRTGAVIPELEQEIKICNDLEYQKSVTWLFTLQDLIAELQAHDRAEIMSTVAEWKTERRQLRKKLKVMFNPQFGSVFRTYHNPTFFTRRLMRFADIYMSSVENFLQYEENLVFYPRRAALPHEPVLDFR